MKDKEILGYNTKLWYFGFCFLSPSFPIFPVVLTLLQTTKDNVFFSFFLCVHAGIILFKKNLFSAFVHKHDLMLDCTILKIAKLFSIVPSMMVPTTAELHGGFNAETESRLCKLCELSAHI